MSLVMKTRTAYRPSPGRQGRITRIGNPSYLPYVAPVIIDSVNRPAASAGDALRIEISAAESKSMAAIGAIQGVAILAVSALNGKGTARLRSYGSRISWRAPGSKVFGSPVNCPADGLYLLADGEYEYKTARIQVYTASLATFAEANIFLQPRYNSAPAHADVSAAEASAGDVTDYTVTIRNASPAAILNVKAWIKDGPQIQIGYDGLSWVAPNFESHPDTLAWPAIQPNATETLHCRRTIPAGSSPHAGVLNVLMFSWDGI